ncbi:MAG: hypothetical protein IIB17_10950 [Chloroflexi bacterium]|nr:hypothetical protein [Chloroflexota bacterium]
MRASLIMLSQSEASGRGENRGTLLRARPFDCGLRVVTVWSQGGNTFLAMLSRSEASGCAENGVELPMARPFDCGLRVAMVMMRSQSGVVSWLTTESYAVTG